MTTNPFYNALLAHAYIVGVATLLFSGFSVLESQEESIFIPIGMLALLVLSVAVMAYLFFFQPIVLLLDGEREKAVKLFLQTIGIFAGTTILTLLISITVSTFGGS